MYVVYTRIDETSEPILADWPVDSLPLTVRARVAGMENPGARARTVAGLLLLRIALADEAGWQRLGRSATGRPEIAGGPWFSISHSGVLVACAVACMGPIGLDVEARRDTVSPRLVTRIVAPGHDFFSAWCAREATVKASGRVGLARVRAIALGPASARLDGRDWPLLPLALDDDHAACLVVDPDSGASLAPPRIEAITPARLIAS